MTLMKTVPMSAWPSVDARTAELIRLGALQVSDPAASWIEDLHTASLSGPVLSGIASDPGLRASTRRANLSIVMGWIAANIERPGERVDPRLSADVIAHSRDLVRRGMDDAAFDAYRKSQAVAWRRWLQACFTLTEDATELRELLELSAHSIAAYVDDVMDAVRARMQAERADLTTGTHADRLSAVTLLLEGARAETTVIEARLGYRLSGAHTGLVVWGEPGVDPGLLETAAEAFVETTGAPSRLTVIANSRTLWVWLPLEMAEDRGLLRRVPEGVRVAAGRPAEGREGFRSSHLEAVDVQRTMERAASTKRLAFHRDTALISLLLRDPQDAEAFLHRTLGDLHTADPELRHVALTYLREMCSVARTAEVLFAHRNTVLRRLRRVDELLPRPLAADPVHVAAALELMSWREG